MASIRKRGTRYEVQFRRKGHDTITRSFLKLSDAKEWERLIEGKADRYELAPKRKELDSITLGELVTRYRDEVVPKKKGGEIETIVLNAFLRHPVCKKSLSSLTKGDATKYRNERLQQVSPATLRRQWNPILHMFNHAIREWELPLRDHPFTRLRLDVGDGRRERRLRAGELHRLMEASKANRNPHTILIVGFALETAMRRGEILALTWNDIDFERSYALIREAKNGHSRTIPLSPRAVELLEQARVLARGDQRRVFPLTANGFRLSWERLAKRAGIDDLHFHDLRHEAISRLFELGLTAPEVASISGHRDMRMLFRYAHASQASVRAKLLSLDQPAPMLIE